MEQLETERLRLRKFTLEDTPFILELLNSDGWIQFIGDRNVKTEEDAKNYLKNGPLKSYAQNGFGLSMVELKDDQIPIGMCGLLKRDTLEDVDLGFAFLPQFMGKRYALEIADCCLHFAFHNLNLKRVVAITVPENKSCISLLSKIGMTHEKNIILSGDPKELAFFSTAEKSDNRPPFLEYPELKNDRVHLRDISSKDSNQLFDILFYNQKEAGDINGVLKILKKVDFNYRQGTGINWGIVDLKTSEIAGTIGFYRGFKDDTGEIGFVTKEKFRRQGLTYYSILELVKFGYQKMNLKKIVAYTKPDNFASQNLLKKSNFLDSQKMENGYLEFVHQKKKQRTKKPEVHF